MTDFVTVTTPDGRDVRFPKGMSRQDMAAALNSLPPAQGGVSTNSAAVSELGEKSSNILGVLEQGGTGANEGLAWMAGLPVDAVTSAINGLKPRRQYSAASVDETTGRPVVTEGPERDPIVKSPIGGSESILGLLSPFMSDSAPNGTAERYARAIGREVGAGAVPGLGVAARAAKPLSALGLEAASSLTSGAAQQGVEDAGGGPILQALAGVGGGIAPVAMSSALTPSPRAPSMDDMRARQSEAYDRVDASPATLSQAQRDALLQGVESQTVADDLDALTHPKANRMLERLGALPDTPTVADVERLRRIIGRDVAGSADTAEAQIGVNMKQEIDNYLRSVAENEPPTGSLAETLNDVQIGRDSTRRIHASEGIERAIDRGELRAASSGTGGNEVNAIRQNLRRILDNPKLRRGYTEGDLSQIESVVRGTPTVNAARLISRLSPGSGALPMYSNLAALGVGTASSNPAIAAATAVPGIAGFLASDFAERSTRRSTNKLVDAILNDGPVQPRTLEGDHRRALVAALLGEVPSDEGSE